MRTVGGSGGGSVGTRTSRAGSVVGREEVGCRSWVSGRPRNGNPGRVRDTGGMDDHEAARTWVAEAERIVVLTGAGISTDSGIPDFRGPNGVWTKNPGAEKMATIQHYLADPDIRRRAWRTRVESPAWDAMPNAGHRAIAGLEAAGRLRAVITQNVDGLHQMAGNDPALVVEVHGTIWF